MKCATLVETVSDEKEPVALLIETEIDRPAETAFAEPAAAADDEPKADPIPQ